MYLRKNKEKSFKAGMNVTYYETNWYNYRIKSDDGGMSMSLIQDMKKHKNLMEREQDIRKYILEHPEKIEEMSSRELGHATICQCGVGDKDSVRN